MSASWSRVIGALKGRPATRRGLAKLLATADNEIPLFDMVTYRKVIAIGTVAQARAADIDFEAGDGGERKFVRLDAQVYALPGTALLPALEPDTETTLQASRRLPRKSKGSGKVAGPRTIPAYRWGWPVLG